MDVSLMEVWTALRIIVRDREWRVGLKIMALALLLVGGLLLRAFSWWIVGLSSAWWFYALIAVASVALLILLGSVGRRYRSPAEAGSEHLNPHFAPSHRDHRTKLGRRDEHRRH
jgi:membrane protein YdbS with pleckstrin-like domain